MFKSGDMQLQLHMVYGQDYVDFNKIIIFTMDQQMVLKLIFNRQEELEEMESYLIVGY